MKPKIPLGNARKKSIFYGRCSLKSLRSFYAKCVSIGLFYTYCVNICATFIQSVQLLVYTHIVKVFVLLLRKNGFCSFYSIYDILSRIRFCHDLCFFVKIFRAQNYGPVILKYCIWSVLRRSGHLDRDGSIKQFLERASAHSGAV